MKQKINIQDVVKNILNSSNNPYERVAWMLTTIGWFSLQGASSQKYVWRVIENVDQVVVNLAAQHIQRPDNLYILVNHLDSTYEPDLTGV